MVTSRSPSSVGVEGPDRRDPTTSLTGWRRFVATDPATFDLLPDEQWKGLEEVARQTYDEARLDYHSELVVVTTSTVKAIIRQGSLLTVLNRREVGARRGLIVSGDGTTGKTTALKQFGRAYELRVRARYPDPGRIPVVYVTTPASGSPRKLALEFARFLGLPEFTRRDNTTDIAEAVCRVLVDGKIDVVLVDEIHNLNLATRPGEDLSDHLKYFTEHIPATFVYAGIDVERSGLFTGIRGRQLAGRCVLLRTSAFGCVPEWHQLIAALEGALRLHAHVPGTLAGQARYLHQRTGGMIGSLMHLVRAAAITAILDGSESITAALLDDIQIDHSAQSAATPALLDR